MAVKKTGKASDLAEEESEVPLQAVLLADSFAQKFRPITLERPKVLLPLVNIPMIDYTLEWLASAGVEEVFVFCCAHAKQITSYLDNSAWHSQPKFKVVPIESHDCVSVGEALRVIDQRNVVRGDFVLISGDTVSNMSLKEVLQEHKERRKVDKLAVMTMVVKRSKPSPITHQNRLGDDEILLAIDPLTKELLLYDDGHSSNMQHSTKRQIVLDKSLYISRASLCLCTDLQDCYIDICSPEVLLLFTDNFDYQHLRRDFVKGILSDEISGNKIFTHEISGEYAARIDNLRSYDSVSKDIIHRWTYPIVPDIRFAGKNIGLKIDRCNVYRENGVSLPRSATIGPATVLGEGTIIGDNCTISHSVIGRNCSIGKNVKIEGSYVWNNVVIQDGVHIQHAVICDGCIVKSGAVIGSGAVLSFGVVIGANFIVRSYSKFSLIAQPTEEDSSDEELEYVESASITSDSPQKLIQEREANTHKSGEDADDISQSHVWDESQVGVSGAGYLWSTKNANQDEEWRYSVAPIPQAKLEKLKLEEEQENLDDAEQDAGVSAGVEEEEEDDDIEDAVKRNRYFEKEADETFRRLFLEGVPESHVILEVKALRLGFNASSADCAGAVFKSILNLALEQPHSKDSELFANTKKLLAKWKNILEQYLSTEDDQVEVLLKFEEICLETGKPFAPIFCNVVHVLYDQDTLSENAILSWASEKQGADESDKIFLKQCEPFIRWLQEASEEEDDDDT